LQGQTSNDGFSRFIKGIPDNWDLSERMNASSWQTEIGVISIGPEFGAQLFVLSFQYERSIRLTPEALLAAHLRFGIDFMSPFYAVIIGGFSLNPALSFGTRHRIELGPVFRRPVFITSVFGSSFVPKLWLIHPVNIAYMYVLRRAVLRIYYAPSGTIMGDFDELDNTEQGGIKYAGFSIAFKL